MKPAFTTYDLLINSFRGLPEEVIVRVLHYSTYKCILRFAKTCKRGLDIVSNTTSIQLLIELELNGLEIVKGSPKDGVTYSLILEELGRYRDAWLDFDFCASIERPMGKQRMELWELREGAFVEAFTHTGSRSQSSADTLQFIPIDTASLPPPVRTKHPFHDFTHDASQELVVLVGVDSTRPTCASIYICSTTDGLPHSLALRPIISIQLAFSIIPSEPSAMTVDVTGNLLVTKFAHLKSYTYEILVWDWHLGILLNRISSRTGICDVALLDQMRLILYSASLDSDTGSKLDSVSLIAYNNITSPSTNNVGSKNANAPFDISSYPVLDPVATFRLPKLDSSMTVVPSRFLLRSDPTPGHSVYTSSASFACSSMVTLALTLSLTYTQNVTPHSVSYRIFVSAGRLLDHLDQEKPPMVFPWSEWGESATRWFVESETSHRHDWICWMSAGRYIRAMSDGVSGTVNLSLMDFCTPRVRKSLNRTSDRYIDIIRAPPTAIKGRAATFEHRWVADHRSLRAQLGRADENQVLVDFIGSDIPTTVALGLEQEVVSRLPYRTVTKLRSVPVGKSWLIDGSHIIGSDFQSRSGPRPPSMTVYKLKTSSDDST